MPRNGSGTFSLVTGNPVVSGTVIESTWANNTLADIADSITNSLARNGEGGMTAPLRLTDGVVATPSLAFANETGSGLYRAAAGDLGLSVLGSRILRLQAAGASVTGTLGVSGATTLSSTLGVTGDASFVNAAYTGTLTGGTGIVNIGTGQIYKAADGKVGIGTVTPATLLNLYSASPHLRLTDSSTGAFGQFVSYDAGGGVRPTSIRVSNDGTGGTTDVMTWTSSRVGIGTSNPATALHINGSAPQLRVSDPSTGSFAQFLSYDAGGGLRPAAIRVSNDGTGGTADVMTFTSSGNVGIGTSSPGATLSLFAGTGLTHGITLQASGWPYLGRIGMNGTSGGAQYWTANYSFATSAVDSASYYSSYIQNSADQGIIAFGTSSAVNTAPSERARIDSNGNLSVGTTSNSLSDVGLRLGSDSTARFTKSGSATLELNRLTSDGSVAVFYRQTIPVGGINVTSSSTSYATSSDYRLKENVAPMTGALAKVQQLKPCTYTWKADGSAGQGFIAHELQAVVPDCVTGEKDAVQIVDVLDDEGRVIGTKEEPQYQGVDTSFLVATLVAAIQELSAKVEALETISPA